MEYWIFGANGYIGEYIYRKLVEEDRNAVACSRVENNYFKRWMHFDIFEDNDDLWKVASHSERKAAIVCVAESNIENCINAYEKAYDLNVTKTIELIDKLHEHGFYVLFLSSDNVFSGKGKNYLESDVTDPENNYGKMKVIVEKYIVEHVPSACIFRLSKVVSPFVHDCNIFTQWERQYNEGQIKCIKGNKLCFVYIQDIYNLMLIAIQKHMSGIYHVVGSELLEREDFVKLFFQEKGLLPNIVECNLEEFHFCDKHMLCLDLSNEKIVGELGYTFKTCKEMISNYLAASAKNRRYVGLYEYKMAQRLFLDNLDECFLFPKYLTIETCNNCNARCIMCPKGIFGTKQLELMEDALFDKIVEELQQYASWIEMVCLNSDGEPLIDKDICNKICKLKKIGIKHVNLSTNGKLLNAKKSEELIEAGIDDIRISIDAFSAETYEKIRRGLKYEEIMRNVLDLINIRDRKGTKTEIRIRMVEMPENESERSEFLSFWSKKLRADDKVQIMPAHTWSGVVAENATSIVEFYADKPCVSVFSTIAINYDGMVQLCDSDIEQKVILGNLNEKSIKEIWQSEKFEKIRHDHMTGNRNQILICQGCDHWSRDFLQIKK